MSSGGDTPSFSRRSRAFAPLPIPISEPSCPWPHQVHVALPIYEPSRPASPWSAAGPCRTPRSPLLLQTRTSFHSHHGMYTLTSSGERLALKVLSAALLYIIPSQNRMVSACSTWSALSLAAVDQGRHGEDAGRAADDLQFAQKYATQRGVAGEHALKGGLRKTSF